MKRMEREKRKEREREREGLPMGQRCGDRGKHTESRMLLWAQANKWESADICTLNQLRKRGRRARSKGEERRERKTEGGGGEE